MSADWIRFTPAPLMSAHALPSDPPASMPRVASSMTSASKPALRASSAGPRDAEVRREPHQEHAREPALLQIAAESGLRLTVGLEERGVRVDIGR